MLCSKGPDGVPVGFYVLFSLLHLLLGMNYTGLPGRKPSEGEILV
jgi:hypothetical protein